MACCDCCKNILIAGGATTITGSNEAGGDITIKGTSHPDQTGSFIKLDAPITYVTQKLDVGDDIPDVPAATTTSILDISPTVDLLTSNAVLNTILVAPTTTMNPGGFNNVNWIGMRLTPTISAPGSGFNNIYGVKMDGTVTASATTAASVPVLFQHATVWSGTALNVAPAGSSLIFADSGTYQYTPATGTGTVTSAVSLNTAPAVASTTSGGTAVATDVIGVDCGLSVNGVAGSITTVTTRTGLRFKDRTLGGTGGTRTVTTQIGVDIPTLAGATTNVGIRNASTTVYPISTQNITAVGQQILPTATMIFLNPNAAYILNALPTIPPGVLAWQEITLANFGAGNLTLQDDRVLAGTKFYLPLVGGAPANMVLNPGDFVTLVWSGAFWFCKCRSDNV